MSTTAVETGADLAAPLAADLVDGIAAKLVDEIERYLAARRRTAHPLVTATTGDLVRQALAELDTRPAADPAAPELPAGLWRILPDRLLSLHPGRLGVGVERLRVSIPEHLELTALVLERWGWAQTGSRIRTGGGRRCILGAQHALYRLGWGTEVTVHEAGRRIQGALVHRGVTRPYWEWNDQGGVTSRQAIGVVLAAAGAA